MGKGIGIYVCTVTIVDEPGYLGFMVSCVQEIGAELLVCEQAPKTRNKHHQVLASQ